jgi:hypothetical protein
MISSSASIIVPLSADDFTTADVQDNQVYNALTSSLPSTTVKKTHYMIADHAGYNDQNLYDLNTGLNFQIVCPVHRYKNTPHKKDFNWLISMNLH